jgi:hypothetical protein
VIIEEPDATAANGAVTDVLQQEPGGYSNFEGLFGTKYLAQALGRVGPRPRRLRD